MKIYEYDQNGDLIRYTDSGGYEYWCEYDGENNLLYLRDIEGNIFRDDPNFTY